MYLFLFIFGCAASSLLCRRSYSCSEYGLLSHCDARAFHCGGFSCCGPWAHGHRLNCHGAWALLFSDIWGLPRPGVKSTSLHWQVDSLPLSHQGRHTTLSTTNLLSNIIPKLSCNFPPQYSILFYRFLKVSFSVVKTYSLELDLQSNPNFYYLTLSIEHHL